MKKKSEFAADLIITGEKVSLIPISSTYAPNIFKELTEEVIKYLDINKTPVSINATLEFIDKSINQRQQGTDLVMVILDGNDFLGVTGIHEIGSIKPHMGLWLKKEAQGKGYGKATVKCFVDWARKTISFKTITYSTHKENNFSIRIIESLGGVFDSYDVDYPSFKNYHILP